VKYISGSERGRNHPLGDNFKEERSEKNNENKGSKTTKMGRKCSTTNQSISYLQ